MKLTVVLLLSLAATSIIGTIIQQNQNPAAYLRAYGEFYYKLFNVLGIFDMYHSWWFQFLIIMVTANIVVCSIDRFSATWKIVFVKNPPFHLSRFRKLDQQEVFTDKNKINDLKKVYEPFIAKRFGYTRIEQTDKGFCIFAEKQRWTRFGVYTVHLSVVVLLLGGLVGSIFGFQGFVSIPEGEKIDSIRIRSSDAIKKLGFEIQCEDFDISFYANGAPKEFRSSLTIIENGRPVYKKDIIVNDPLRYKGINIFQSSYGKMPSNVPQKKKTQRLDPEKEVILAFSIIASGKSYKITTAVGKPVDIPEDLGKFVLVEFRESADFMGQNIGEAFVGILTPNDGNPVEVLLPLHFPNFDKMRRGAVVISVSGQKQETFIPQATSEPRYYTGLQITQDPGVWLVYTGFIVMIIGCIVTFFMSHQRLCVEVIKSGKKSKIVVAGTANKNKLGMENKVKKIARQLEKLG
ncbi:MAG: cytochrome c biogenesis protein ResB [Desulfobacterales bacterium]|nr:MAG: cytochrome c biogenesis protein ResB [Desulfobacterales bacterium]